MSVSVLVPMDDSPPSKAALEYALETFSETDLTVLYVIDTTAIVGYGETAALAIPSDYGEDRAEQLFDDTRRLAAKYDVELTTVTERGVPAHTIKSFIEEHEFDHVVMGSHCRTGVNRLLLGSVAERVVRRASVPVTIVP